MGQVRHNLLASAAVLFAFLNVAGPAFAQAPASDLDALITPSLKVDTGMALARQQMADNDLLGAAATLERVLIANQDSVPARLLYASLLCRLDDRQGAQVEINLLPKKDVPDAYWSEVTTACGVMQRPGKSRR